MRSSLENRRSANKFRFNLRTIRRWTQHKIHLTAASAILVVLHLSSGATAADVIWDGSSNANWSVGANWTANSPPSLTTDVVRFDNNSTANLNTVNDIVGLSIAGIANTSAGANNGPTGPMTITGNALTLGTIGLVNGSGNPMDPNGYTGPAQANITVDVDLTLSADQRWKIGGPGTATTAQPSGNQAIIVGASPNSRTVTLNGFKPTVTVISNPLDMIILNSRLVDGSAASSLGISKVTGTTTTFAYDTGNINNNPRVRISGDSTYSGGTTIIGGRQLIQLGTSTVMSGSTIVSGPLGTGTITVTDTTGSDQGAHLVAFGANRTLNNPIAFTATGTVFNFTSSLDDAGQHNTLTLGGDISVPASATLTLNNGIGTSNNQRNGSGDVIINGNISLAGAAGTLSLGQGGASPSAGVVVGKMVINGNILEAGSGNIVSIINGTAAVPTVVQLSGQSTYAGGTTLTAGDASSPTANANLGIGSSTILDGGGNIISGPVGIGTLNIGSATIGTTSSIEALGGARTVANPVNLVLLQSNLAVRGSNDLTLSGAIGGFGGTTMNGTGKLTLAGANNYIGATAVNSGTMLVNGSLSGTSGVTVAAGATLGGTGSISSVINNNGTIAPGASVGTLTTLSDVIDGAGSSWAVELSGALSDRLAVGGNLDLSQLDTLNVSGSGSGSTVFTIATYAGTLTGTFDTLNLPSGYTINYGTGTNSSITLTSPAGGLAGDFNSDGKVDAGDYVTWRKNNGTNNALANDGGLGTPIGPAHFNLWRANFGNPPGSGSGGLEGAAVPEPATLTLLATVLLLCGSRKRS
jgi:fibronectin-binding autotransporter adhesin